MGAHQDHKTDTKKSIDAMMTPIGQFVKVGCTRITNL
jgi:hypothetical protein